jgi:hypothetical protein
MKIFVLILNVIGFWLMADAAHAGPVVAAIGMAFSSLGAIGGMIAKVLLSVALNFPSSLLQKMMAKKQKQEPVGVKLDIEMGDDLPVSSCIGKYATAGRRKYAGTYGELDGTPNVMFVDVIELGNLPAPGQPEVWINDEKCTVLWDVEQTVRGYPIKEFEDDGEYYAWIRYFDGTQTQADIYLRNKFGDHADRPWTEEMIGRGVPYAVMTFRFNQDFFSGVPNCIFEMPTTKLYDIRKDSTAGGNGPHRWNSPSTWEPSTNLPVMIYNVIRGMYYGNQWFFGGQNLAASRLPASNWIAAAQEASRLIQVTDQPTEPQFRGGYEITGDMEPLDVIDDLRAGCAARIAENGGSFKIHVGSFGAAVFAFSDADIIVTEGQSFEPFPGLDQTINAIKATYPEPKEKWASKDAPTLYNDELELADGNRTLPAEVQFPAVPFKRQVQRLMRAMIKEERRFRTHQFYLPPEAWVLEPNDVIAWSSERNGYENKKFIILSIEGEMTMNQLVTIKEIDPADYDWSPAFELPTAEGWIGRIEVPAQEMTGWSVSPATIDDNDGNPRRPAIKIECANGLDDVMKVWVQVRNAETGDTVFDSDQTPYADPYEWLLSGAWCLPASDYEARGKYVPYTARKTNWSPWLPVTTPDTRMSFEDLEADIVASLEQLKDWIDDDLAGQVTGNAQALLAEVQARIEALQAQAAVISEQANALSQEQSDRVSGAIEASERYRAILDELGSIRDYASNNDYAQYEQKEELRRTLTQRLNSIYAEFDERITVATGENGGIVERVTTLEVRTDDAEASILLVDTASVDRDAALSAQISLLSAGTASQFDPARLWPFDTSVEGWSGNGAPTAANGYLRPANQASDPYVVSPVGLGITANQYRQVRARIRKTGSPVWEGYCWWQANGDTTWDASRRLSIAAPTFDANGFGIITFDLAWTGTINQIRLDLSTAQTVTDYFEMDMVAIGAPSPGASRAELLAEQSARASGDTANAQDITALQALFQDVNGDITALASGVSVLTATVTNLEDSVQAQSEALVSVTAEVAGKASLTALQSLTAEVEALGGGGIVSQGQSITAIRNELLGVASEVIEQDFGNFLGQQAIRGALTEASQTLSTRIESTDTSLTLLAEAVTRVQAVLPGLATAQGVTALTSRVTAAEGSIASSSSAITALANALPGKADATALGSLSQTVSQQGSTITSQGAAITAVQNALPGKADGSALQSLSNTVTEQGNAIFSQGQAITSLSNSLGGKADATAVTALTTRVSSAEGTIGSQGSAITSVQNALGSKAEASALQSLSNTVSQQGEAINSQSQALTSVSTSLGGKADASALQSLAGTVSNQGGQISANASALTALSATVGGISADARLKFEVQAGPAGYSRIGARARYDTNSDYREAAWYLDVPADPANQTQFLIDAQRFALIVNGGKSVPFAVDANGVYIQSGFIRNITTDQITFKDNSVLESALGANAAAERKFFASASVETPGATLTNIGSVTINKNAADYHEVDAVIRCENNSPEASPAASIEIRLRYGNDEVDTQILNFTARGELQVARLKYMTDSGSGSRTYSIAARTLSGTVIVGRRTLAAKRDKKSNA